MVKHDLQCCALCNFTASDDTPIEEIQFHIKKLKREAPEYVWTKKEKELLRQFGQRAAFTIVSPREHNLEANLKEVGFELVTTFNRRFGYPEGELKMYMYKF